MDPATLGIISLASTAVGAVGSIQQANAASAAAGYNAKVAERNSELAIQNANYTAAQGEQNVAAQGAENRAKIAAITAQQAASGVDVNQGSSVGIRESASKIGMLDALNLRSQAARQAYGYQTQSANDLAQAKLDKAQGKSLKTAGYISAGSRILGGVADAGKYYKEFLNEGDPLKVTTQLDSATGGIGPSTLPWANTPSGV